MTNILFPTDTTGVTPATGDIIMIADVSDSNNPKDCTLAELPISTATQTALDAKQGDITLTTTGTSGAATLIGDTLNIPQYSGGGASTFIGLTDTPSSYTGQTGKFPKVNAGETALEFVTLAGGGDALTTNPLSQFASTTSAQLAGVISDETGSGALVFATSPTLVTPVLGVATATSINGATITSGTLNGSVTGTNTGDNATNSNYTTLTTTLSTANTWSAVQTFLAGMFGLRNVANTFTSFFTNTNTASRTYTLQNRSGTIADDTDLALKANLASPTFTGTVGLPAGQVVNGVTLSTAQGTSNFLRGDGTYGAPAGGGDMVLASTQTVSGLKTFLSGMFALRNVANTFSGFFTNTNTADRTYTLKDANGTLAFTSDITGTNSGTNTGDQTSIVGITGTFAQFNTAVTDAELARTDAANTFTGTQTITQIDLGNTDTSLTRVSAGQLGIEGVRAVTTSPLVLSAASYTTDTGTSLDMDNLDMFVVTAQAGALLFNAPGGTLVQGRKLIIRIKDNGTSRALTWNAVFRAMGTALPTTTVLSKTLYLGFVYNSTDSKFDLIASAQEA